MQIPLEPYFKRIRYHGTPSIDAKTLKDIHRCQSYAIPFEMLDAYLGVPPNIDPGYIFEKLVIHSRGGGCSQLNELLALALESLGFEVERHCARVLLNKNDTTRIIPMSHKIFRVKFNDEIWLCNAAFPGLDFVEPIPFILHQEFHQTFNTFRLITEQKYGYILQVKSPKGWVDVFAFHLNVMFPEDFKAIHHFNSTSKSSLFSKKCFVTMPTPKGRKNLIHRKYQENSGIYSQEIMFSEALAYHACLKDEFNIVLPNQNFIP